jgi:hypothetical protein
VQPATALCRSHHRLKTTGLITVQTVPSTAGTGADALEWTSRVGLRYRTTGEPATPAPAPAALRPLLALVERDRRESDEKLAWINSALRCAYARGRCEATTALFEDLEAELEAEVRHHDYGDVAALCDADTWDDRGLPADPRADAVAEEPAWMRSVRWTAPDDEPDEDPDDENEP